MTEERAGSVFSSRDMEHLILWLGHRVDDLETGRVERARRDLANMWGAERKLVPIPVREVMTDDVVRARIALAGHPADLHTASAALRQAIRRLTEL